jgi:hypothetical protein
MLDQSSNKSFIMGAEEVQVTTQSEIGLS